MILLRTILLIGMIVFFHRLVNEINSFNLAKMMAFLFVTIIAITLLFVHEGTLRFYFPFFMITVLLGAKSLESIENVKRKDER